MNKKEPFFGIDNLPSGMASHNYTPGCVVLEGGALRGLYTQGVLDALMEEDINMQTTIGVSAGAMSGINYVSGQIGRSARSNLTYAIDHRYIGLEAKKHNEGIIGFDFLFEGEIEKTYPIDWQRFNDPQRRFVAVVTNCETGKPEYKERDNCSDMYQAVRASASMPYVTDMVELDGNYYLDGGCSDKIPVQWAIDQGYDKIIVVRTRPTWYRKKIHRHPLSYTKVHYRKYPELTKDLLKMDKDYNDVCEKIEDLDASGRIFTISPSEDVTIKRLETNVDKLGRLYYMGYQDAKGEMSRLKDYLSQ